MTARIIQLRVPRAKAPNRATNTVPGATVARAPTQLVPLKALAGAVLARNQARNRGATERHNCAQLHARIATDCIGLAYACAHVPHDLPTKRTVPKGWLLRRSVPASIAIPVGPQSPTCVGPALGSRVIGAREPSPAADCGLRG